MRRLSVVGPHGRSDRQPCVPPSAQKQHRQQTNNVQPARHASTLPLTCPGLDRTVDLRAVAVKISLVDK